MGKNKPQRSSCETRAATLERLKAEQKKRQAEIDSLQAKQKLRKNDKEMDLLVSKQKESARIAEKATREAQKASEEVDAMMAQQAADRVKNLEDALQTHVHTLTLPVEQQLTVRTIAELHGCPRSTLQRFDL